MTVEGYSRRQVLGLAGGLGVVGLVGGAGTHALLSGEETFQSNSLGASSFDLEVACLRDDGFTVPEQDSAAFPTAFADPTRLTVPLAATAGETRRLTLALKSSDAVETSVRISMGDVGDSTPAFELDVWEDTDADTDREGSDAVIESAKTPVVVDDLPVEVVLGECAGTSQLRTIGVEWRIPSDAPTGEYAVDFEVIARQCTQ
ncbi:hypothetical protein [Haloarchaeobius sp. DYHT-AS-18]|uniref:hypothetical protein n=1 Tax=Haloarchaeobius sp. DYHT-AS-18 TaxID=3446117 RepID=UPI003EBD0A97